MGGLITKGIIGEEDINFGFGTFQRLGSTGGLETLNKVNISSIQPGWIDTRKFGTGEEAFQEALDYAFDAGGGRILFPPGTHTINSGLLISAGGFKDANIILEGAGPGLTRLRTENPINILKISSNSDMIIRVDVKNLGFGPCHSSAKGIVTEKAGYCQFDNLEFMGAGIGMSLGAGNISDVHNQLSKIRMLHMGRGLIINGYYNIVNNLLVGEEIFGADAINISCPGNVINGFIVRGVNGVGGNGAVVINGEGTILANGRIFDSYGVGLYVGSIDNVHVSGVNIIDSDTIGLRIYGSNKGHFDVQITGSSKASPGTHNNISVEGTATSNLIKATFTGTDPLYDISEASSAVDNTYIVGQLPNGLNLLSETHRLLKPQQMEVDGDFYSSVINKGMILKNANGVRRARMNDTLDGWVFEVIE